MKSAIRRDGGFTTPYLIAAVCCFMLAGAMLWFWLFGLPLLDSGGTATDDEIDWNTAIDAGYDAIYAAYLTDADTYRFGTNAKGEDYLVTSETDDAITFCSSTANPTTAAARSTPMSAAPKTRTAAGRSKTPSC